MMFKTGVVTERWKKSTFERVLKSHGLSCTEGSSENIPPDCVLLVIEVDLPLSHTPEQDLNRMKVRILDAVTAAQTEARNAGIN